MSSSIQQNLERLRALRHAAQTSAMPTPAEMRENRAPPAYEDMMRSRDPGVIQGGVEDWNLRSSLSKRDTDDERRQFLDQRVGSDGWTTDSYGRLALTPRGQERVGMTPREKPVLIDGPDLTLGDFADLRGDMPAILGGVGAGLATGGIGWLPGIGIAALGAAGGKALGETEEQLRGENTQPFEDVAVDVAREGILGAAGEGVARGLFAAGRKAIAPYASRVTPQAVDLIREAERIGVTPNTSQVLGAKAPIVTRMSGMLDQIFGPKNWDNAAALRNEADRLRAQYGAPTSVIALGEAVRADTKGALAAFKTRFADEYAKVDEAIGGRALVPTDALRERAAALLEEIAHSRSKTVVVEPTVVEGKRGKMTLGRGKKDTVPGQPILHSPALISKLKAIQSLPERLTFTEMQTLRSNLADVFSSAPDPGNIQHGQARALYKAASQGFEDAAQSLSGAEGEAFARLAMVNDEYRRLRPRFHNQLIQKILADPEDAVRSGYDPEQIYAAAIQPGRPTQVKRLMRVLSPKVRQKVRRVAMQDILSSMSSDTIDPLQAVFTPGRFADVVENMGKDTLESIFGAEVTKDLMALEKVTRMVTAKNTSSGGIVAANIALHPVRNLGKLAQLWALTGIMNSKNGRRWLTVGLSAPRTTAGTKALIRLSTMAQILGEEASRGAELELP